MEPPPHGNTGVQLEVPWHTPHPLCVYSHQLLLFSEIQDYLTLMHKSKFSKHFHIHKTKRRKKDTRVFKNHPTFLPPLTDERIQSQKFKRAAKGHLIGQWSPTCLQALPKVTSSFNLSSPTQNCLPSLYLLCSACPKAQHNCLKGNLSKRTSESS